MHPDPDLDPDPDPDPDTGSGEAKGSARSETPKKMSFFIRKIKKSTFSMKILQESLF